MKHFTFTNNSLRTYVDNVIYSFKYINKPINDENVFINIDFGPHELNKLVILIPNVKNLNLYFGDVTVKYDLSPLIQLKNIKTISINSLKQEKFLPRLLNIKLLKILNLSKLIVYGQTLNPIEPLFLWPKIKNTKFLHINKIERHHDIINYDIKKTKIFINIVAKNTVLSENIILQDFGNGIYQIIYRQYMPYHEDKLNIIPTNKKIFLSLIYNQTDIDIHTDYPKFHDDLFLEDLD
ncbi:hypothetical protein QJ854_gp428 [Moumouvirus goulette]|uniref:Uncharacterized protein n=1 Tax=Moumouvirus goulette TaxID=1247379 RepID=M1PBN9_9VIRU|nr:hypothetical protein QJ854_gp428 [Moumouvirus goulette]AGF85354.1 hypothetical protein glt_00545 [Moumouvirus goulette]